MRNTIFELITGFAQTVSDESVIITPKKSNLSYQQLLGCIAYIQKIIDQNEFTGANVAVIMPQGSTMAISVLALMSCATCIPINPELSSEEVNALLEGAEVKAVLTLKGFSYSARQSLMHDIKVVELAFEFPWQVDSESKCFIHTNKIALILHTSGSTAAPKKVCLTHDQLLTSCSNLSQSLTLNKNDVCLNMMPLFHVGGLVDLFLAPLSVGGSVIFGSDSYFETFLYCINNFQPTWYQAVPTVLRSIVDNSISDYTKSKLRFIRAVSSPLPLDLEQQLKDLFNIPVIQIYGMSETAGVISSNPLDAVKLGSVGKAVGCKLAIIDAQGNLAKENIEGEIVVSGSNVMSASSEDDFVAKWFKTEDLGFLDEDGYLFITGRSKEMINRGGEKIAPFQIDQLLENYPGIIEAAAFALPHQTLTEQVALALVTDNKTELFEKQIIEYLSKHLAAFKLPQQIFNVDFLPRTTGGKLQRHLLPRVVSNSAKQIKDKTKPNSEVSIFIAKTWQKSLKVKNVFNEDDFFELGGDSLSAVAMMLSLEKRYDMDLPTLVLLDNPTLLSLSKYIIDNNPVVLANIFDTSILPKVLEKKLQQVFGSWSGQREYDNSLITGFNTLGDEPPIFWCCQRLEEALFFIQNFDSNQPIYVMRSLKLVVRKNKRDYVQLAKRYIEEIIQIQPLSDYYLGGYCAGADVMFEVAKHLTSLKRNVKMLGVLDSHIPQPYDGNITLFCGTQKDNSYSAYGIFNYPQMGLGKLYTGSISAYFYDTNHFLFLQSKESAAAFSQDFKKEIGYARGGITSPKKLKTPLVEVLDKAFKLRKLKAKVPRILHQSTDLHLNISLTNNSDVDWQPSEKSGVTIGSRWKGSKGIRIANAGHIKIEKMVPAKSTVSFLIEVITPKTGGFRWLEIDLVEEGCDWLCGSKKAAFNKMIWVRNTQ